MTISMELPKEIDVKESEVSPYKLSKIASELVGRYVREQMVYSYVRQGLIKGSKNELGKWSIKREDANVWLNKYVPKHVVK